MPEITFVQATRALVTAYGQCSGHDYKSFEIDGVPVIYSGCHAGLLNFGFPNLYRLNRSELPALQQWWGGKCRQAHQNGRMLQPQYEAGAGADKVNFQVTNGSYSLNFHICLV